MGDPQPQQPQSKPETQVETNDDPPTTTDPVDPTTETETENAENSTENTEEKSKTSAQNVPEEPPEDFSNEKYACDRQYVVTLAQLMASKDREKVYRWVERLDTMEDCDEVREERDMYLKFLTLSVNNAKLVPPFNKLPPPGLRPLSTIMPRSVYNLIYKDKYFSNRSMQPQEEGEKKYSSSELVDPKLFFSRQPVPHKGGFVYAVAFSQNKSK